MISKKMWIKQFKEELFLKYPLEYHIFKYLTRKAVKNRFGLLTPRETIDELIEPIGRVWFKSIT